MSKPTTKKIIFKEIPGHDVYLDFLSCKCHQDEDGEDPGDQTSVRVSVMEILDIGNPICEDCGEELDYNCTLLAEKKK